MHFTREIQIPPSNGQVVMVIQELPAGDCFFDPFQLGRILGGLKYSLWKKNEIFDLESPYDPMQPNPQRLVIEVPPEAKIPSISIHARYPVPRSWFSQYASILLPYTQYQRVDGRCLPDGNTTNSEWKVPVGSLDDFYLVQLIILIVVWGALFVLALRLRKEKIKFKIYFAHH